MNLFLRTRTLTDRHEDHLTEFLAAALDADDHFRSEYARFVLGDYAVRNNWLPPQIRSVRTQAGYSEQGRPDMVIELSDGHLVACEHKIEAPETSTPVENQASESRTQLLRYLGIPGIDAVLYVRATLKPPIPEVLASSRYIAPTNRQHFLWRDLYPLLRGSNHACSRWLADGFEALGFTPPHPFVGDLVDPASRQNFAAHWVPARARASELGWKVSTGSVVELYLEKPLNLRVPQIWVSPWNQRLLFRLSPASSSDADAIARDATADPKKVPIPHLLVEKRRVRRQSGATEVVDFSFPIDAVLGVSPTVEQAERALASALVAVLSFADAF